MNLTTLLSRGRSVFRRNVDPFVAAPVATAAVVQPELPPATPQFSTDIPAVGRRRRQSWFGWLFGNSRRKDDVRLVQGELLLHRVKPIRNDFRDDSPTQTRAKSHVLWETPRQDAPRDDQDHAWNRLRNRRSEAHVVKAD